MVHTQAKAVSLRKPAGRRIALNLWLALVAVAIPAGACADVLLGTNGERFVGTVIEETTDTVVFESELSGRLTLPRVRILDLQRSSPAEVTQAMKPSVSPADTPVTQTPDYLEWQPPGIGQDGADWVQLKSGEWLRGEIRYIQNKEVEFDSDELEELTLKLKDVRKVYSAHAMFAQFAGREPVLGKIEINKELVSVLGAEPISLPRDELTGITPDGGKTGVRNWSGKFNLGAKLQSGNTRQTTLNTSAELARRTPDTTLLIDYLGNKGTANGESVVDNQRINTTYDMRLDRHWFARAVQFEYYRDPLANIAYRLTGGVGVGYYIYDRDDLEWTVAAGPSYQYTKFSNVEPGASDTTGTPAAVLQSRYKIDFTKRLSFIQTLESTFTDPESGRYSHHAVTTLEYEIKRHLNLDISFIWDYLANPQPKSDGVIPYKSDFYTTVSLGLRF